MKTIVTVLLILTYIIGGLFIVYQVNKEDKNERKRFK